jgi:hypothetical protein
MVISVNSSDREPYPSIAEICRTVQLYRTGEIVHRLNNIGASAAAPHIEVIPTGENS